MWEEVNRSGAIAKARKVSFFICGKSLKILPGSRAKIMPGNNAYKTRGGGDIPAFSGKEIVRAETIFIGFNLLLFRTNGWRYLRYTAVISFLFVRR